MNDVLLPLVGTLTGLHAATWGGFKDSPFEGFRLLSFVRSLVLGLACALLLAWSGVAGFSVLVAVGLCYAGERLATEWWKTFLRENPQASYAIPMRLAVRGRTVDARLPRYLAGVVIAAGLVLACLLAARFEHRLLDGWPWWALVLVVGVGGWFTAVGGAWKDAPIEGFQPWKFIRSPVVATTWGGLLLPFSASPVVTALAAGGWSVLTIETYKTYLVDSPPGKFAGKPVLFLPARARDRCCLAHALLYVALAGVLAGSLARAPATAATYGPISPAMALLVVFVWATGFATQVLDSVTSATVRKSRGSGGPAEAAGRTSHADLRRASE